MRMMKKVMWTSISAAALSLLGCDRPRERADRPPEAPPPVVVQEAAPQVTPPQEIIVQQAPPPLIVETPPPLPGPGYIWVGGYWNWDNQRYVWVGGRYSLPPQPDVEWIAPRYDRDERGYHYIPGQWRPASPAVVHAPDRLPDRVPDRAPDRAPDRVPDRVPDRGPDRGPGPGR